MMRKKILAPSKGNTKHYQISSILPKYYAVRKEKQAAHLH
jgi:hypothetical protein